MIATLAFIDGPEGIVVLVVVLLLVGANRLPKLARQLGEAQRELKKGMAEAGSTEAEPSAATVTPPPEPESTTDEPPSAATPTAPVAPAADPLGPPLRPPLPPPGAGRQGR